MVRIAATIGGATLFIGGVVEDQAGAEVGGTLLLLLGFVALFISYVT